MNAKALTALLLGIAFASGCARREAEDDTAASTTGPQAEVAPLPPPPPKEVAAVKVDVTLSPAAAEKLKSVGETVHVEVIYGGDAAPGATLQPNELGMIELGKKVLEIDGAGTVELPESEVDKSRLDQIVGQPQIMVNTTSSRKSSPENLLACGFYWDTLSTAGRDGVKVNCTLLTETQGG